MSKSIVQREKECYICRYLAGEQGYYGELPSTGLHRHHIMFGTANRKEIRALRSVGISMRSAS